ncbi:pyridoxal phosphate-dependent aminotransferase [candidate division WOR-3 bacterium]|nr:pyridoxal phosphate-dependent aminotransferase [candidate division WOR-3 bacterium]
MREISPSTTLKVLENAFKKRAEGKDISILAAGEPDFDTPDYIKEAAIRAIKEGKTKYTPVAGIPELRRAIVGWTEQRIGINYSPDAVLVSSGAKQSIFNVLFTLIEKGDEVIIITPYWVSYPEMVRLAGGSPVFVDSAEDFHLDIDAIGRSITGRTRAIILNSPNNPTGVVYTREEMEELAGLLREKEIYVISDEIYDCLVYEGKKNYSIAKVKGMRDKTFVVNGVSKSFAMTGWRIGWVLGPERIIKLAKSIQSHTTSCPSSISQYAALAALTKDDGSVERMRATFEKRRNRCIELLSEIPGISFPRPDGAFYLFLDVSRYTHSSFGFATELVDHDLAIIPGIAFGKEGYLRLSYASSLEEIEKGIRHLKEFIEGLREK